MLELNLDQLISKSFIVLESMGNNRLGDENEKLKIEAGSVSYLSMLK